MAVFDPQLLTALQDGGEGERKIALMLSTIFLNIPGNGRIKD
jgi:hypothetical protein